MEKALKKRIAIGVGALAVGGAIAFGVVPAVVRQNNRKEMVVRVTSPIGVGEKIVTGQAGNVKLEQVFDADQPSDAETNLSAVDGKAAKVAMNPKDTVTSAKISDSAQVVPDGKQEISVPVKSNAAGLTGGLQAGDIVSVYGVSSNTSIGSAYSLDALKYVKVLSYYNGSTTSSSNGTTNVSNATLTLLVTSKQAQALAAWDNSTLHFALVSRGDTNKANDLLKQQDTILQTIPDSGMASTNAPASQSADSTVSR